MLSGRIKGVLRSACYQLIMHSLQELLIKKVVFDGAAVNYDHLPRTLAAAYRNAAQRVNEFQFVYEEDLGAIAQEHLRFHLNGHVNIDATMENLLKFDKIQAFKYSCALNKTENLPEIWKNLSETEKASLQEEDLWIVAYRVHEISSGILDFRATVGFLLACCYGGWEEAFFGVYSTLSERLQKRCLPYVWKTAVEGPGAPRQQQSYYSILRKLLNQGFKFYPADTLYARRVFCAKFQQFLPLWESKKMPKDVQIELFDRIMKEQRDLQESEMHLGQ